MPTRKSIFASVADALIEILTDLKQHEGDQCRDRHERPRRVAVSFGVPIMKFDNGVSVQMAIKIPDDAIASVRLSFQDVAGHALAGNVDNVSATVSDPSIASVAVTSDGQWVQITPLATSGSGQVTYTDSADNISATLDFEIVTPQPSGVSFDESSLVLRSNPNPPAGAPGSTLGGAASGGATGGTDTTGGAAGGSTVSGAGAGADTTGGAASGTDTTSGAATAMGGDPNVGNTGGSVSGAAG